MIHRKCICHSGLYKKVFSANSSDGTPFTIVKCIQCGLKRTWETPNQRKYMDEFIKIQDYKNPKADLEIRAKFQIELMDEIIKLKQNGKLLDIGCYIGGMVKLAKDYGFEAQGIDLDINSVSVGKGMGLNLVHGNFMDYPFKKESFDAISMSSTLQHIVEFGPFLMKAYSILKPGGIIAISEPNCEGFFPMLMKQRWYPWSPREDVWHFSPKTLIRSIRTYQKGLKVRGIKITNVEHELKNPFFNALLFMLNEIIKFAKMGDKMIIVLEKQK